MDTVIVWLNSYLSRLGEKKEIRLLLYDMGAAKGNDYALISNLTLERERGRKR